MAKDIEDFLRRAAERRRQQQAGQPPARSAQKSTQPDRQRAPSPVDRSSEPRSERRQPRSERAVPVEEIEIVQKPVDLRSESVVEHVTRHFDNSNISDHAEELGSRIKSVRQSVDSQVHRRLDHDLTSLDDPTAVVDDSLTRIVGQAKSDWIEQLRAQLSDPGLTQQAILLSEILNRPDYDSF